MPKRKKSSRRPASSRPHDDQFTPTMPHDNPRLVQTSISIDDDEENHQNPNPKSALEDHNSKPKPEPEDGEGRDLVELHKPQSGDADPDNNEQVEDDGEKPIELDASSVSEKPNKRKHDGNQGLGPEKKLKQVEAIGEEDVKDQSPTLCLEDVDEMKVKDSSEDNPQPQNLQRGSELEETQVKETSEQQQKVAKDDPTVPPSSLRKTPKRKKAKLNVRQRAALERKLSLVQKNLNPIPFVPEKKLDFSKHEQLFRRLGLWDFVNMEFDQDIRSDLIALLIVNYNPSTHSSIVNDVRIKLSRADLARALKLPVKKDKSVSLETSDFDSETLSEETQSFIVEFLSYWILLHEDTWILPDEVLNWDALIKKGEPHKVDWPRFLWYMVEKELKNAPETGTLYFASHIQCLMKSQRDDLFLEKTLPEAPVEVEKDFGLMIGSSKDYEGFELEKQKTELCLGQTSESKEHFEVDNTMDYQESKQEAGVQAQWSLDENNNMSNRCLQQCSMSDAQIQHEIEEVEDEEYDPQPKSPTLGVLASTDPFQEIDTTTYDPSFHVPVHSSGDLFQSGIDAHMNPGSMSMFVNSFDRDVGHNDMEYHHALNGHDIQGQRSSDILPPDFNLCIEQMHSLADKAKAMYEEKEKVIQKANMNAELISDLHLQNDTLLDYIQNMECDLQRRAVENCKLEREIHVMTNLLEEYRNALKETRRAFSEYRERNPEPEEPLYKDAGPGGLVLSTMELEKRRAEREEEDRIKRCIVKQVMGDFEADLVEKFDGYKYNLHQLEKRLLELEGKVKLYQAVCSQKKTAGVVNEV